MTPYTAEGIPLRECLPCGGAVGDGHLHDGFLTDGVIRKHLCQVCQGSGWVRECHVCNGRGDACSGPCKGTGTLPGVAAFEVGFVWGGPPSGGVTHALGYCWRLPGGEVADWNTSNPKDAEPAAVAAAVAALK